MYYGKMTKGLEELYSKYEKIQGHSPDACEDAEYGEDEYDEYVADIKKALKLGVSLPDIYPHDDEF